MLNLTEYKKRAAGLVDYLPWADLIAPGVVLNKNGSYQRSFVYRGPDLENSTEAELVAFTARFNTILKRSSSGWAVFFEAQRIPAQGYPAGQERHARSGEQGAHCESCYLLTFVYLPPEIPDRTERIFFERSGPSAEPDYARAHLDTFLTETDRAAELMSRFLPELAPLDDVETLKYLHGTISTKQHVVNPPEIPTELNAFLPPAEIVDRTERIFFEHHRPSASPDYARAHLDAFITETERAAELMSAFLPELAPLDDARTLTDLHGTISARQHVVRPPEVPTELDAFLCDTSLASDVAPRPGDKHGRVLTVLSFPNTTAPGLLDDLNDLGYSYRWMTRWIALDKVAANKQLTKLRRQWFSKRKSVGAVLREVMFNREAALVDNDADNEAIDADAALQELGADDIVFGHITTSLVVMDKDEQAADEKLLALERVLNGRGVTTICETLNAAEVWLGSLPSNLSANVRQPIVHILNLVHMMPASSVWAGPSHNPHLNAPPLMLIETNGTPPFRLDLHVGDVGHTLIVGPTGAGKSVLLAILALQFLRFIGAQVIAFDKGCSLARPCSPWAVSRPISASTRGLRSSRWPISTRQPEPPIDSVTRCPTRGRGRDADVALFNRHSRHWIRIPLAHSGANAST